VRFYFFGLVLVFVAVTLVRIRGWFGIDSAEYEVSHHGRLTEGDNLLTLKPIGDMRVEPHQGQYIYLRLGLVSESHPFSVLNYEPKTGELTVAYRLFGMFTNVLSQQPVGTRVSVSGPYGEFMNTLAPNEPTVYISGGIGITPFAYQLQKDAGRRDQWLFAANRSRETAVLLPWLRESLHGRLVSVYSRENSPTLKQNEERGYITASLLRKYLDTPTRYSYYLCGPAPMMQATRETLQNMGISESRIYSETFGW
jgi:predicted ferric reductase